MDYFIKLTYKSEIFATKSKIFYFIFLKAALDAYEIKDEMDEEKNKKQFVFVYSHLQNLAASSTMRTQTFPPAIRGGSHLAGFLVVV